MPQTIAKLPASYAGSIAICRRSEWSNVCLDSIIASGIVSIQQFCVAVEDWPGTCQQSKASAVSTKRRREPPAASTKCMAVAGCADGPEGAAAPEVDPHANNLPSMPDCSQHPPASRQMISYGNLKSNIPCGSLLNLDALTCRNYINDSSYVLDFRRLVKVLCEKERPPL